MNTGRGGGIYSCCYCCCWEGCAVRGRGRGRESSGDAQAGRELSRKLRLCPSLLGRNSLQALQRITQIIDTQPQQLIPLWHMRHLVLSLLPLLSIPILIVLRILILPRRNLTPHLLNLPLQPRQAPFECLITIQIIAIILLIVLLQLAIRSARTPPPPPRRCTVALPLARDAVREVDAAGIDPRVLEAAARVIGAQVGVVDAGGVARVVGGAVVVDGVRCGADGGLLELETRQVSWWGETNWEGGDVVGEVGGLVDVL